MPRFRSGVTGVVIDVDEETTGRLGTEFAPVESDESKAPAKKSASRKSS